MDRSPGETRQGTNQINSSDTDTSDSEDELPLAHNIIKDRLQAHTRRQAKTSERRHGSLKKKKKKKKKR